MENKEFIKLLTAPFPAVKWVVVSGISKGNPTGAKATYSPYISTDMVTDRLNDVMPGCYEISTSCTVETITCVLTIYFPEGQVRKFKALGTFNGTLQNEDDIIQAKATNALKKAFEYLGYSQCKALGMQEFWHTDHPKLAKLSYKQDQQNAYINERVMKDPEANRVPDSAEPEKVETPKPSKEALIKGLPEQLQMYIAGNLFSSEEMGLLVKNLAVAEERSDEAYKNKWVNAYLENGKERAIKEPIEEPTEEPTEEPVANVDPKDLPF